MTQSEALQEARRRGPVFHAKGLRGPLCGTRVGGKHTVMISTPEEWAAYPAQRCLKCAAKAAFADADQKEAAK